MRQLKHHERKLLRKVNFFDYNNGEQAIASVISRFRLQGGREEYLKYSRLVREISRLVDTLKQLPTDDPTRVSLTQRLLRKVYDMGLIQERDSTLEAADKITVSDVCRRRLPTILVQRKMAPNMDTAVQFVEAGHIRIGPTVVTDPAYLITREREDLLTWVSTSKIRRQIDAYNNEEDDYLAD